MRDPQDLVQRRVGDGAGQEPIPILRKHRRHPDRIIDPEPHEPAEAQVVVALLHELPLAPHGGEHLEEQGAEELLGRDRPAPQGRGQGVEAGGEGHQHRIDKRPDHPERVIGGNPVFERDVAEPAAGLSIRTAHRRSAEKRWYPFRKDRRPRTQTFSATC